MLGEMSGLEADAAAGGPSLSEPATGQLPPKQSGSKDQTIPPRLNPVSMQEIRIAAVLNGGVSLAIWMGGVSLELHHLALSSQGVGNWSGYRGVLDLLGASARIDVIAGTSAGGLNGAFLALALAHRRDLSLLRNLWTQSGSFEAMLRPASGKNPPSLLQGDGYFQPQIEAALRRTVSDVGNPVLGQEDLPTDPVELILTGTLWNGRETPFTDDMGVGITERDYDALFRFARAGRGESSPGNLDDTDRVIPELAEAARCSSSFPGAFEPHLVRVTEGPGLEQRWPSSAGQANFENGQYVIDGGVLLNKPIRPALDAIYRQTGDRQIRRILTYIVPHPGEPPRANEAVTTLSAPPPQEPPAAGDVVLGVMTRLRSTDSVSRELGEIRDRNTSARARRRARGLLSQALIHSAGMSEALWDGYLTERTRSAATIIARLIGSGQQQRRGSRWSERELTDALLRYAASSGGFSFVPSGTIQTALAQSGSAWRWGQTTVGRLGDQTVDFLKRVVWFAQLNSDTQSEVVACRKDVAKVLDDIRADRDSLNRFWISIATGRAAHGDFTPPVNALPPIPDRQGQPNESATNLDELDAWLARVVPAWDTQRPPGAVTAPAGNPADERRAAMHDQVLRLAAILNRRRSQIQSIIDNPNPPIVQLDPDELAQVKDLERWLFKRPGADGVLQQMLRLDIVQFATSGGTSQVEQEVELIQVSCSSPDAVTGVQLHHFGAFYRAPWRVNDWIEGRLDGAKQVIRMLLSPERLRQRGYSQRDLYTYLHALAVPPGSPYREYLEARWQHNVEVYVDEVDRVIAGASNATALDEIAEALAMPLRLQTLAEDLSGLADAVRDELSDSVRDSVQWLRSYEAKIQASPKPPADRPESAALSATDLWTLREEMRAIGTQTISGDIGSDTFARTVSQAATVGAGVVSLPPRIGRVKAIHYLLSTVRGYTALVWTMVSYLTRGSAFGTRIFELAVAIGGSLLALSLLVPGVPLALTLAGVLLLFAGITAAALRTPDGRWFGIRLAVAALLVAAWLAYVIWRDIHVHHWSGSTTLPTLIKAGVGVVIVLLGSFVAQSQPTKKEALVILGILIAGLGALLAYQPW